jgi:hypothetical protein
MTARRFMLVSMLVGGMLLATGCKSLAGASCLKQPEGRDVGERPPLRTPVGLDPVDDSAVLKVPPPVEAATPPPAEGCLEDPPSVEKLTTPVDDEKAKKKQRRKERRDSAVKKPGPRLN